MRIWLSLCVVLAAVAAAWAEPQDQPPAAEQDSPVAKAAPTAPSKRAGKPVSRQSKVAAKPSTAVANEAPQRKRPTRPTTERPAPQPAPVRYAVTRLPPVEHEPDFIPAFDPRFIPPSGPIAPCDYGVRRLPPFPSPLLPWVHRHMPWYCPPAMPTPACTHLGAGWGYYPTCWRAWPPFSPLCPPPVPPEFCLDSVEGFHPFTGTPGVPAAEPILPNPQPAIEPKRN